MQATKLWRLEYLTADTLTSAEKLAAGMELHLRHAPLLTVEVRLGTEMRSYIGLDACPGCTHERCMPGCHADLFRRLLHASAPATRLMPIPGGLAPHSYTRACLARPVRGARALSLPDEGTGARLIVKFEHHKTIAMLLASDDGPDPAAYARAARWRALPLPKALLHWAAAPFPSLPALLGSGAWMPTLPGIVLPAPAAQPHGPPVHFRIVRALQTRFPRRGVAPARDEIAPNELPDVPHTLAPVRLPDEPPTLVARLLALALQAPVSAQLTGQMVEQPQGSVQSDVKDTNAEEDVSLWPGGPGGMPATQVAYVITALLQNGEVRAKGVSRKVLRSLAPGHDMALFVWFDRACLFAEPHNVTDPAQRWRERRRFLYDDATAIAERLSLTALPDTIAVQTATVLLGGTASL